ncbi:MAG: hypothetical protein GDA44_08795 [Prochloron sp. SP5CPC1]|nr:hypothetical protein [Candidatus Paraprochloron terpiosi SP5CPC1]
MIQKIIEITESQEQELKSLASNRGLSEEELLSQVLTQLLAAKSHEQNVALEQFIARAREISARHSLPEGYRFNRQELYDQDN